MSSKFFKIFQKIDDQSAAADTSVEADELPNVSQINNDASKFIDFDDMLPHIGQFGLYQRVMFLLMIPHLFSVAFVYFAQIFITVAPDDHWCYVPELAHLTTQKR